MNLKNWRLHVAIGIDQLANAVFNGMADETLSSRSYRMWRDKRRFGWFMRVIDILFFWQKLRPDVIGHCHQAYLHELERRHLPEEMRKDSRDA